MLEHTASMEGTSDIAGCMQIAARAGKRLAYSLYVPVSPCRDTNVCLLRPHFLGDAAWRKAYGVKAPYSRIHVDFSYAPHVDDTRCLVPPFLAVAQWSEVQKARECLR